LPALGNVGSRLARIAEMAQTVLPDRDEPASGSASDTEARLLFNYVRGNLRAASDDLDVLDRETTEYRQRLSLLYLRAILRWAQGKHDEARKVIEYVVANIGTATERLEETPLGLVVTKVVSPEQAWAAFLSTKVEQAHALEPDSAAGQSMLEKITGSSRRVQAELPDFPAFEPAGPGGPFAPIPAPDFNPPARR
jgi:hypothetical protein